MLWNFCQKFRTTSLIPDKILQKGEYVWFKVVAPSIAGRVDSVELIKDERKL